VLGSHGKWVTMGIPSDGSYGIPKDVMFGFPVTTANGAYTLVQGLPIDERRHHRLRGSDPPRPPLPPKLRSRPGLSPAAAIP